jgi:exodeoxyribonuclease VII large subunit
MVVLTVEQALGYLRELFETNPTLSDLWIMGEISNLTRSSAGHIYFTLKDGAGQIRCAFFKRQNVGVTLEHGQQVLAHGRVSIYEQRGDLNFIVDFVHSQGAGILHAQFERLKQVLESEGLFDTSRKRPLPAFPRRIGVVTSPAGAVLHDICTVIGRRWPLAEIMVAPTTVQGDAAAPAIVAALQALNERASVDVIIVARGGGSLEELWPFNEEQVQRAIYASRVPVVSAVGHETDVTLADYVADLRAPTPSAAAEMVVPDQIHVAMRLGSYVATLESCVRHELDSKRDRLDRVADYLEVAAPDLKAIDERLSALHVQACNQVEKALSGGRAMVELRVLALTTLNPLAVLERGYAVVHHEGGALVARASEAIPGDRVSVRLRDGSFAAEVKERHGD